MGCFLFAHHGLESSPYADLLDPWHWTEVADMFARDACKLLGLSLESPLGVRYSLEHVSGDHVVFLESLAYLTEAPPQLVRPCVRYSLSYIM